MATRNSGIYRISIQRNVSICHCNKIFTISVGLSVSKSSIYSENLRQLEDQADLSISAESVAISLLRRFKDNQLPAASEIEWLVSERDAPQQVSSFGELVQ